MFTGPEICEILVDLGVTHVVWIPDSTTGSWETDIEASPIELVRVCREGEAWPLAAGLHMGGKLPLVVMQTTGLFESGDALRNVLFDLKVPIVAVVGARNCLTENTADSAKRFARPILDAWQVEQVAIETPQEKPKLAEHFRSCQQQSKPGLIIIAEGRG